jgi:hypothetical protein
MKEISLGRGYVARVDDRDYAWLSRLTWRAVETNGRIYAVCLRASMHRLIANAPQGQQVRFKDKDSLNCTRRNVAVRQKPPTKPKRQRKRVVLITQGEPSPTDAVPFLVDEHVRDWLNHLPWYAVKGKKGLIAECCVKNRKARLHRLVAAPKKDEVVFPRDGNSQNCVKANLVRVPRNETVRGWAGAA